ncbi:putative sphingolipid transporter spinster-like protein 1 [Diplonema papillatum]|nr:putative sphingolipid transporter spinster-like protein 1 [Diplonema papillatum]
MTIVTRPESAEHVNDENSPAVINSVVLDRPGRKLRGKWYSSFVCMMWALCALAFFQSSVSTGLISGTLTAIEDEYDISVTLLAVIVTAYDAAYVLAAIPCAQFLYEHTPKAIGGGMLLLGVSAVGYGLSKHVALFVLFQFLMGLGATPLWILSFVHIDDNVGDKSRTTRFTGLLLAPTPLGAVAGLVLAGAFLTKCTQEEEEHCGSNSTSAVAPPADNDCSSWMWSFYILGGCVLPAAIWFFFSKKRYTDYYGDVFETEEEKLERLGRQRPLSEAIHFLVTHKALWWLVLNQASIGFVGAAVITFAPRFFEKTLCEAKSAGSFYTAIFVPFVVAAHVGGGKLVETMRWGVREQWRMMLCSQLIATPFFMGFYGESAPFVVAMLLPPVFLLFLPNSAALSVAKRIVPPELRPHSMAFVNIAVRLLGAVPGPIVLGVLLDSDVIGDRGAYVAVSVIGVMAANVFAVLGWYSSAKAFNDCERMSCDELDVQSVQPLPLPPPGSPDKEEGAQPAW